MQYEQAIGDGHREHFSYQIAEIAKNIPSFSSGYGILLALQMFWEQIRHFHQKDQG